MKTQYKIFVLVIALVAIAGLALTMGQPAAAAVVCSVDYNIQNDWGSGATVNVAVTNTGTTAVDGWTLDWTFPGNQQISALWNGSYTQSGASVSVSNAPWNGNIAANGGTTSFGFNLAYSGTNAEPTTFVLNGITCNGGTPPTQVPPTDVPPTNVPPTNVPPTNVPPTNVPPTNAPGGVYQAENAVLGGDVSVDTNHSGYYGTGFVNFPSSGGYVEYRNVDGGSGGGRTLRFRHALGITSSRTGQLTVNGASRNITFSPTGSWDSWAVLDVAVNLNAGTGNTIRLQSTGQDLANQDQMEVLSGTVPTSIPPTSIPPTSVPPTSVPPTDIPPSNALYVAPNGSASAPGTISQPTTLTSAITRIAVGGTIYMRGGTYNFSSPVIIDRGNDGTSNARKQLFAYSGETPVLNFSAMAEDSANRGLTINGHYWHVRGLIVERAGDNGIFIGGNNNIIERCVTRYNRDSGLQLSRYSSSASDSEWPANNLILSCESHDNMDSDGEDADGFAPKLTVGEGNVFRYCVAHHNIDDGWDMYTKDDTGPIGRVTVEDSISYMNGTLSDGTTHGNGDRNGFKLGGEDISVDHIIRRNLAYLNGKHGFTYNRNLGTIEMTANISIDSEERNFNFDGGTSIFRNNLSCYFSASTTNDRIIGNDDGSNDWWMGSNPSPCSSYSGSFFWQFNADGTLSWGFR
ncbi:MAG: cellulose binding domain-containing protein [Anaerolineae bacterium]|nr:cellulose binding domain-containing protein [Anaerolineae bacterium]